MKAHAASSRRFKVTRFINPSKAIAWRVSGTGPTGERIRQNYPTEGEARAKAEELEIEALNRKSDVRLVQTRLSSKQIADAEAALERLAARGLTHSLCGTVDYLVANWRKPTQAVSIKAAADEFLADCHTRNLRGRTVQSLASILAPLVRATPDAGVDTFSTDALRTTIYKPDVSPTRQNNVRRGLHRFFGWARKRGYVAANLVADIEPPKIERDEPSVLTLSQVRRLLSAAEAFDGGKLIPYVTLALFAGIRPTELSRIGWDDVNIEGETVTITARVAKCRGRRIVRFVPSEDGPSTLADWLRPYALKRTPFVGANWRKDFDKLKAIAGFDRWPQDVLRHSGISYLLAHRPDEDACAAWAGNSAGVIQKHYRALVSPEDAKQFWNIRPGDTADKIAKPNFERKTA